MKEHYQRGGLGDVKTKRYLLEILDRELRPIRERRLEFAKDMGEVYSILEKGSERARNVAAQHWMSKILRWELPILKIKRLH